jgi:hypothetical protein
VNSAEGKGANFCKNLDGKLLFSVLYGMYIVTLIEPEGCECAGKTQWCSEQNLIGVNGPGRQLSGSKETQEI